MISILVLSLLCLRISYIPITSEGRIESKKRAHLLMRIPNIFTQGNKEKDRRERCQPFAPFTRQILVYKDYRTISRLVIVTSLILCRLVRYLLVVSPPLKGGIPPGRYPIPRVEALGARSDTSVGRKILSNDFTSGFRFSNDKRKIRD